MVTRNPAGELSVESRRALLEEWRQVVTHLATADLLERRADRSASPVLAVVLRERANERRRRAERLRADLVAHGAPRGRLPPCPGRGAVVPDAADRAAGAER